MAHQNKGHVVSTDCVDQEAEEYVNSVMSSQPPSVTLRTPLPSGRKRSLSASAADTEVKKHKGESGNEGRHQTKARRSLLRKKEEETRKYDNTECTKNFSLNNTGNKNNGDDDIKNMLRKLSDDMVAMHISLNRKIELIEERIDQSEKKITDKITDKVTKIIDKRVNSEASRLRKELDERLQGLREDFNKELIEINNRLDERHENTTPHATAEDRHLRVVVLNLPETVNEDVTQKVNTVIRDGLKVRNVSVVSAERKLSRRESRPGVVIAKFRNSEEKKSVMGAKQNLRSNSQYRHVYINHDLSREERNMANNMRALLNGVKRGHNMQVRGTRIVAAEDTGDRDGRRDQHESRRGDRNVIPGNGHGRHGGNNHRNRENRRDGGGDNRQRETTRSRSSFDNRRGNENRRRH